MFVLKTYQLQNHSCLVMPCSEKIAFYTSRLNNIYSFLSVNINNNIIIIANSYFCTIYIFSMRRNAMMKACTQWPMKEGFYLCPLKLREKCLKFKVGAISMIVPFCFKTGSEWNSCKNQKTLYEICIPFNLCQHLNRNWSRADC